MKKINKTSIFATILLIVLGVAAIAASNYVATVHTVSQGIISVEK